jgi:hypothetical protein
MSSSINENPLLFFAFRILLLLEVLRSVGKTGAGFGSLPPGSKSKVGYD